MWLWLIYIMICVSVGTNTSRIIIMLDSVLHDVILCYMFCPDVAGTWLQKVLQDMKSKSHPNGNQTLEDMKLFLYSAVCPHRMMWF